MLYLTFSTTVGNQLVDECFKHIQVLIQYIYINTERHIHKHTYWYIMCTLTRCWLANSLRVHAYTTTAARIHTHFYDTVAPQRNTSNFNVKNVIKCLITTAATTTPANVIIIKIITVKQAKIATTKCDSNKANKIHKRSCCWLVRANQPMS